MVIPVRVACSRVARGMPLYTGFAGRVPASGGKSCLARRANGSFLPAARMMPVA
jgi:hypothetical protein